MNELFWCPNVSDANYGRLVCVNKVFSSRKFYNDTKHVSFLLRATLCVLLPKLLNCNQMIKLDKYIFCKPEKYLLIENYWLPKNTNPIKFDSLVLCTPLIAETLLFSTLICSMKRLSGTQVCDIKLISLPENLRRAPESRSSLELMCCNTCTFAENVENH